ncbi:adenosine kinase [Dictyostelium discoideum AX4]|uniref:Adenosine kinase n=1 Tax=Dictyostelium discoideum TaxID=44689 RepID=ADK_DICDI|nr:adenosine kinase [Dictyostelium discoideum AX4]Q54MB5.2 RecName: Full=Adenosine kinase; Short=AK; AltName: Full=Adenosine 5'-phosphotransferase [Dictyostelium discoideum]EAL64407.2 adenosine kinase [Dictyostelium discoideum AX4]|eukprot:XP_637919.2 adenosine kinase [Dictyostelium discoideum AX4]
MSNIKILCAGNPLLDLSTHVEMAILDKYELKLGNAILAEDKHLPLYGEIKSGKVEYIPGGAAQNTSRVCQWMLKDKQTVCYTGCVGTDENATILKTATESNGVVTKYQVDSSAPTGACAVLINHKERSMVTNLGAANNFKIAHFQTEEMKAIVNSAQFFYLVGYFLTVSPDSAVHLGKHAAENDKPFLYGLAAPFLIDFFFDKVSELLPYVDIVFANESEAATLGRKMNWGEDLTVIAEKLAAWEKVNTKRTRTVVFTQGPDATLVFQNGVLTKYNPIKVATEDILDLNAAGDSFCGGFLAAYSNGQEIAKCVEAGHYASWEIIRQNGATVPASEPKIQF